MLVRKDGEHRHKTLYELGAFGAFGVLGKEAEAEADSRAWLRQRWKELPYYAQLMLR